MRIPKTGEFYKHFKNKLYQIVAVAEHSEDGQKLVIYQALYGDFKVYARPLEMFVSEVDHEKYPDVKQKYRFERVELGATAKEETTASQKIEATSVVEVPAQDVAPVQEEAQEVWTEEAPEPGLIEFLDEDDWDMKYNILVSLRDKMTDKLVDDFAVVLDVVIPEGPLDKRYEQLKNCVRTRQKYESLHLR
ncbi:MAG: DUF1653 domain-containing protein [Roseburia sp.]|nr:DUF1653 domain-containing protein [Roseburia sp.]